MPGRQGVTRTLTFWAPFPDRNTQRTCCFGRRRAGDAAARERRAAAHRIPGRQPACLARGISGVSPPECRLPAGLTLRDGIGI